MARSQLWHYLKDQGITHKEAAKATGYAPKYIAAVLAGQYPMSAEVMLAFVRVYPETARFLLPSYVVESTTFIAESTTA